jgi:hypothetical protein
MRATGRAAELKDLSREYPQPYVMRKDTRLPPAGFTYRCREATDAICGLDNA